MPVKVSTPPGAPEVIALTPTRPRLISPFVVSIVGSPANSNEVNLKAAPVPVPPMPLPPPPPTIVSNPLEVSKVEVDPKRYADKGPSIAWPRYILPKSVVPFVVIDGSVVITVPELIT